MKLGAGNPGLPFNAVGIKLLLDLNEDFGWENVKRLTNLENSGKGGLTKSSLHEGHKRSVAACFEG